jgi:hypothetical protein
MNVAHFRAASRHHPLVPRKGARGGVDPGATCFVAALAFAALCLVRGPVADAAEIPKSPQDGETAAANAAVGDGAAAGHCLSRQEQRARIAARTVVPLAKAVRAVRAARGRGDDILHARLCERDGRLVYLLTVLARGGKVVRVAVDAGSGVPISAPH